MSLLMNEDFFIYQLRLGYLNNIRDGVGERLITLNPSFLTPAFRTAGWAPDVGAIRRCYSPPIPTGTADVSQEYFQKPAKPNDSRLEDDLGWETGGMVTGQQGNDDALGNAGLLANERKRERRRRKEQMEEDDSSDLSDESEEEEKGLAHSIRFDKMPVRTRANTADNLVGPSVMVTQASQPSRSDAQRTRSGSVNVLSSVPVGRRSRGDTMTSSGMSSDENEVATDFHKPKISGRPGKGPNPLSAQDDIEEEDEETATVDFGDDDIYGSGSESDDFGGTVDSASLFGIETSAGIPINSAKRQRPTIPPNSSPRKGSKDPNAEVSKLQLSRRPISTVQPVSMLSAMLGTKANANDDEPFQRFAGLSGKGETSPLWIKIYAPFSEKPDTPIEVPIRRKPNEERVVTVADLIGLALFRYGEEKYQPVIKSEDGNINKWALRIVEDGEVDMDLPALAHAKAVGDFTFNNNRPPQRRARDKPWDEFGLVKATEEQFLRNEKLNPQIVESSMAAVPPVVASRLEHKTQTAEQVNRPQLSGLTTTKFEAPPNPIINPVWRQDPVRKDSSTALDQPQLEVRHGATKTGAQRTIFVRHMDAMSFTARTEQFQTTSDSYIAEIFDQSCKRFNLDKALYVLKIHGTQTVAPTDRTVEALRDCLLLDLVRRRFIGQVPGDTIGWSGSPGNSLPSDPIDMTPPIAARSKKPHLLANNASSQMILPGAGSIGTNGKRFNVLRKQPLSFAAANPRTLILEPEFISVAPAASDSFGVPPGKVTNIPMSSIIGAKVSRKHPKMVRILVYREKETKRYDFEASNWRDAEEIVADVRKGMAAFGGG